jgi:hypothetical protein
MFEGVQAEVDALIEMGFGSESLTELFRKKGAKGIRSLWSKEAEKAEEGMWDGRTKQDFNPPDRKPKPHTMSDIKKQRYQKYKQGGTVKKNYAYGGRVAKMSSEKS